MPNNTVKEDPKSKHKKDRRRIWFKYMNLDTTEDDFIMLLTEVYGVDVDDIEAYWICPSNLGEEKRLGSLLLKKESQARSYFQKVKENPEFNETLAEISQKNKEKLDRYNKSRRREGKKKEVAAASNQAQSREAQTTPVQTTPVQTTPAQAIQVQASQVQTETSPAAYQYPQQQPAYQAYYPTPGDQPAYGGYGDYPAGLQPVYGDQPTYSDQPAYGFQPVYADYPAGFQPVSGDEPAYAAQPGYVAGAQQDNVSGYYSAGTWYPAGTQPYPPPLSPAPGARPPVIAHGSVPGQGSATSPPTAPASRPMSPPRTPAIARGSISSGPVPPTGPARSSLVGRGFASAFGRGSGPGGHGSSSSAQPRSSQRSSKDDTKKKEKKVSFWK